jgi:hypothetical protein
MNLVEIIAFYATLVLTEGRQKADQFLQDTIDPKLHGYIKPCVSNQGLVINTRGNEFFFEDYQGVSTKVFNSGTIRS